ncbi:type IV secretion system protein [Escherichia sp. E4736]|uniref:virB8 family protein n=1 Tax=Escherichia sp. E4736 TaxID=2044466 RepID=UPI0014858A6C|nr:type IV secretion system protein [Escherichia sp. E4736]
MFGKRKNELIKENYDIEKYKNNTSAEDGRNISLATQAYVQAAQWFEKHVAEEEKKKVKNAKRLSVFFGMMAFMSVSAVLLLTPLKTVVPYVIRVDNNSGFTDIVRPGADQNVFKSDDAYWSVTYILNRESYDISSQDFRSRFIELSSYPDIFTEYKNFQLSKKGYLEKLADKQQLRVTVRNVSNPVTSNDGKISTIQIRFNKTVTDNIGQPDNSIPATTWLATISYDYSKPPKFKKDEWMNPRGFAVKSYQLSQEVGY